MVKPTVQPSGVGDAQVAARARITLVVSVVVTVLVYTVPYGHYVAYPLVLISTLVHELGHGLSALLMGGSFHQFEMFVDGSGVAQWSGQVSRLGRAFIAAGGLVGPAVAAAVCFACARRRNTARLCLGTIGVLLALAEVLVVRNGFGLAFVGILAALCLLIAFKAGPQLAQISLVFLAVQLALSVYSRGDYLFMKEAQTANGLMPSDSQHIAEALVIAPYWFWGGACAAFSIVVLLAGGWYFLRRR
ncbi:M50 family metallopeptidase [Haliangium sp.]|uniref:M50 family metallopeptidase n=1 Tax=Haliangium sp. TaxID=2663208 RepID=UPI003D0F9296